MSNFIRPITFEFELDRPERTPGLGMGALVLTAELHAYDQVRSTLTFRAMDRGTLFDTNLPAHLNGLGYTRKHEASVTVRAATLFETGERAKTVQAETIVALAREQLIGEAAESAVWSLFWDLVLLDPQDRFVDSLEHAWLTELRDQARRDAGVVRVPASEYSPEDEPEDSPEDEPEDTPEDEPEDEPPFVTATGRAVTASRRWRPPPGNDSLQESMERAARGEDEPEDEPPFVTATGRVVTDEDFDRMADEEAASARDDAAKQGTTASHRGTVILDTPAPPMEVPPGVAARRDERS